MFTIIAYAKIHRKKFKTKRLNAQYTRCMLLHNLVEKNNFNNFQRILMNFSESTIVESL